MRAVAARCGVAVGTVYNYFPSKEMLAAGVMLEDWQGALARMEQAVSAAADAMAGLRAIFLQIAGFCQVYERAWSAYADGNPAVMLRGEGHELLVSQLSGVIAPLLARFGCAWTAALPRFLAENLLSAAAHGEARFDEMAPLLARLL